MNTSDLIKDFFQVDDMCSDSNPKRFYYRYDMDDICPNQILSRYMSINSLIHILNGKFYVSKKEYFDDKLENDTNKIQFCFKEFGEESAERITNNLKIWGQVKEISKHLLTSCWTLKKNEDFLMWSSYTDRFNGVMIKAPLENILSSFINPPLCKVAKIYYQDKPSFDSVDNVLFFKSNHFKHEEEIRLYFRCNNSEAQQGEKFDVNPSVMIDEIILSPFMKPNEEIFYTNALATQYPFIKGKIRSSDIELNVM